MCKIQSRDPYLLCTVLMTPFLIEGGWFEGISKHLRRTPVQHGHQTPENEELYDNEDTVHPCDIAQGQPYCVEEKLSNVSKHDDSIQAPVINPPGLRAFDQQHP